jgi:hypothetical protein
MGGLRPFYYKRVRNADYNLKKTGIRRNTGIVEAISENG